MDKEYLVEAMSMTTREECLRSIILARMGSLRQHNLGLE